jgi:hypothetical protein
METANDGVDFSVSNARDWGFQLIGVSRKCVMASSSGRFSEGVGGRVPVGSGVWRGVW